MAKALRIGIPLTTIGWVALGIVVTIKEWDQALELTGIGGVIMAWSFCLLLVPGLVLHVALIMDALEEWVRLNLLLAISSLVWYGSAYRLLRTQMRSRQRF